MSQRQLFHRLSVFSDAYFPGKREAEAHAYEGLEHCLGSDLVLPLFQQGTEEYHGFVARRRTTKNQTHFGPEIQETVLPQRFFTKKYYDHLDKRQQFSTTNVPFKQQ